MLKKGRGVKKCIRCHARHFLVGRLLNSSQSEMFLNHKVREKILVNRLWILEKLRRGHVRRLSNKYAGLGLRVLSYSPSKLELVNLQASLYEV